MSKHIVTNKKAWKLLLNKLTKSHTSVAAIYILKGKNTKISKIEYRKEVCSESLIMIDENGKKVNAYIYVPDVDGVVITSTSTVETIINNLTFIPVLEGTKTTIIL